MTEAAQSRRRFLRWLLVSAVGVGAGLVVADLAGTVSATLRAEGPSPAAAVENAAQNVPVSLLSVKAVYFLMAQYVYPSEEYFVLQNPAVLRDLLSDVVTKHPSLAPMIATMEILRDGAPVKPDSALRDGDEIDFIPTIAGG